MRVITFHLQMQMSEFFSIIEFSRIFTVLNPLKKKLFLLKDSPPLLWTWELDNRNDLVWLPQNHLGTKNKKTIPNSLRCCFNNKTGSQPVCCVFRPANAWSKTIENIRKSWKKWFYCFWLCEHMPKHAFAGRNTHHMYRETEEQEAGFLTKEVKGGLLFFQWVNLLLTFRYWGLRLTLCYFQ